MHRDFRRFHMALNMDERCLVRFYDEALDLERIVVELARKGSVKSSSNVVHESINARKLFFSTGNTCAILIS